MVLNAQVSVPGITMEDELGITYLIENAQQFWSELEDMLNFGKDHVPTLSQLDSTLRRFLALCATYHEQYLQSPLQFEHACGLIIDSELFEFHSERMCEIIVDDVQSTTNPHSQLIFYHVLLCYGQRRSDFFRSHKRWQPLLPLLMDHILVEIDPDVEDTYFGIAGGSNGAYSNVPVPIEAKLRSLCVRLLYEVCRVQKLSVQDLKIFDDAFMDYLFDLVEQTRHMHDETFNYSVIKLIVSLNEQFMVALLGPDSELLEPNFSGVDATEPKNRVIRVLMRRLGSSKTFGENMIFMLNRAQHTAEDLCMQLLILKILYVLFTTKGTSEYFYTNDLCVLVDVFLRELVDLDEDSESLRHTYLRVLHPLLTKTQLRDVPYKRPQIVYSLESLIANPRMRDVNPTTKRLVERCLSGDWCVNLTRTKLGADAIRVDSPASDIAVISPTQPNAPFLPTSAQLARSNSKNIKSSKSVENLRARPDASRPPRSPLDAVRRPSNASSISLSGVANAIAPKTPAAPPQPKRKSTISSAQMDAHFSHRHPPPQLVDNAFPHHYNQRHQPQLLPPSRSLRDASDSGVQPAALHQPQRRSAPPPPPKRRKPPAIPVERTLSGATITAIKSSASNPLVKST
ncbi:Protein dip1 [Hypsizygus marmoreus]|uniref:Protein dip1 n=1 Tax=Hypsizygus marmoreus TaxID=39966 RepID=A0A369JZG1_HYPMA|nr:Protein dip1 [Hypsizygus marmoreus]